MKTPGIVLLFIVFGCRLSIAEDLPNCDVSKSNKVHFSSVESADVLTVTISGRPCFEADLRISIASENGAEWYRYVAPFKWHIATHWEDPDIHEDAQKLAERILNPQFFGRTSLLPAWTTNNEDPVIEHRAITVSKDRYNELRKANWITFSHPIHYESVVTIVFDQEKQQAVVIMEDGV